MTLERNRGRGVLSGVAASGRHSRISSSIGGIGGNGSVISPAQLAKSQLARRRHRKKTIQHQ
jgi:hypothetical protein